jgi:uncharacterized protein (AIM24 family)
MIAQRQAFLVAEKSVNLDIHFRRRLGAGLFGGEGFVLQKLTGPGVAFVCLDGEIMEYTLAQGEVLKVDTGHVAMYEPTVSFDIEMVKGFTNILFGGEGLFLARSPGSAASGLNHAHQDLAKAIMPSCPRPAASANIYSVIQWAGAVTPTHFVH